MSTDGVPSGMTLAVIMRERWLVYPMMLGGMGVLAAGIWFYVATEPSNRTLDSPTARFGFILIGVVGILFLLRGLGSFVRRKRVVVAGGPNVLRLTGPAPKNMWRRPQVLTGDLRDLEVSIVPLYLDEPVGMIQRVYARSRSSEVTFSGKAGVAILTIGLVYMEDGWMEAFDEWKASQSGP